MTITLLETKVYEGKEIVAVYNKGHRALPCVKCVGFSVNDCSNSVGTCSSSKRMDRTPIIWLYAEQAALARLRGEIR